MQAMQATLFGKRHGAEGVSLLKRGRWVGRFRDMQTPRRHQDQTHQTSQQRTPRDPQNPHGKPGDPHGRVVGELGCRARREQPKTNSRLSPEKWREPKPESGLDCMLCAEFARQRTCVKSMALVETRTGASPSGSGGAAQRTRDEDSKVPGDWTPPTEQVGGEEGWGGERLKPRRSIMVPPSTEPWRRVQGLGLRVEG